MSLTELCSARGKLGLPIERDLHVDADKTISCAPQKLDSLFDLPIEAQPVDAVA